MASIPAMILFTLLLFPAYLALRYPFFRLPLHLDTGFYVSNHTVARKHVRFSRGWNAHFAGCSKVIPELFYSLVYLWHRGSRYGFASHLWYSVYNYVTAVLVGYAAYVLGGREASFYYIGLACYCLLSSEPHYGVYFESAEQFEVLFHLAGWLLVFHGFAISNPFMVAAGVGVWLFDGFFVKLSSLISSAVIILVVAWRFPASLPHVAAVTALVTIAYAAWVLVNRKSIIGLLVPLIRHESYFGHRFDARHYVRRAFRKAWFLWEIASSMPVIPGLALLGAVVIGERIGLLLLYLAALAAAYVLQVAHVWYYTIPFTPLVAILAAFGVAWLAGQGTGGVVVTLLLVLTWLGVHLVQSYGRLMIGGVESLNRYTWEPHRDVMAAKNLRLEQAIPALRSRVGERDVFIFGEWNQSYALLDTSYETPLVCAARWLDHIIPDWHRMLNESFVQSPPTFLLETSGSLDVEAIGRNLGLAYRPAGTFGSEFRLFELAGSVGVEKVNLDVRPYIGSADAQQAETVQSEMEAFFSRRKTGGPFGEGMS